MDIKTNDDDIFFSNTIKSDCEQTLTSTLREAWSWRVKYITAHPVQSIAGEIVREDADRTKSVAFGPGLNPHILILSGALPYSMPLKHLKDRNQDPSRGIEIAEVDKFNLLLSN